MPWVWLELTNRAKSIQNKPVINEDPKDALLRKKQDELDILRAQIQKIAGKGGSSDNMIPSTLKRKGKLENRKLEKRKQIDITEMEKENMKVMKDKLDLRKDLEVKQVR